MKKRALILAMIAFITAIASEPAVNTVYAEETQTEESAGQASELPVKALTPKAMDVNPYMAASDSNIHHDCYNTDSCLLYTSPSPRDRQKSRMPSSA